jgi:SAM-dependent methyltransferase
MKFNITREMYQVSNGNNKSLIYGEVNYNNIADILINYNLDYTTFIDIGSGSGKIIINLSDIFVNYKMEFVGIEIEEYRFDQALKEISKRENINNINFENKDFKNIFLGDYDYIYCCNTIFEEEDNIILYKKLLKEFNGICFLFTMGSTIIRNLIDVKYVETSWCNNVPIYIYEF